MANRDTRFLIKRSNVPGKIPTNGDLLLGELGLNTADAILYTSGTTANTILPIGWDRVARTGDTMTGGLFTPFLSATTVSATTYLNLPVFTGDYLPLSGGTVYGPTIYSSGLTANTLNVTGLTQTSGITSTGGIIFPQKNLTGSYTATTADYFLNVTGGTFDITLMSAVGVQGKQLVVKNEDGGIVNVISQVGETIDDRTDILLTKGNSVQMISDGVNWVIIGYNISSTQANTGVIEFSGLSKVSSSIFSVAPVKGFIVDDITNPTVPFLTYVEYTGGTHTDNYVTTAFETYVYITSGGTISQQSTPLTPTQRRQNIFLGKLGHPDKTVINLVFSQPDYVLTPLSQLRDMFIPINLINGGVYPSPNANLTINNSAGYIYGLGINFSVDELNPNAFYVSGGSPTTFQYRTKTGGTITNTTFIDPLNYDLNGVITPISGTKATNQRVYLLQNGSIRVMYGQHVYSNFAEAVQNLQTETFTPFPNFINNAVLIGIITLLSTVSDLTDTSKAQFFFASKFGETIGAAGGVSTTTLQQAYNNSTTPEITTNSTLGALSIKNGAGTADNVTRLFEGVNAAGNTTSFIRADGDISGTTIQTNGFTANTTGLSATTVSATTYYNLPIDVRVTGGTYSSGTATFTNNTGGTFSVTGFSTSTATEFTGGTVTGTTNFTGGLTANTISATTYSNLPTDIRVTGATYSNNTFTYTNNTGGTFNTLFNTVTGLTVNGVLSATTISGDTIYANSFPQLPYTDGETIEMYTDISGNTFVRVKEIVSAPSGGTRTFLGDVNISSGLTATTISATTYYNLPTDIRVTGGTYSSGTATFTNNTGGTFSVTGFSTSTATAFTGGTVTGATNFIGGLTANTISATTYYNLPTDIYTTGGTRVDSSLIFTNNTGGTFTVTGTTPSLQEVYTASTAPRITTNNILGAFRLRGGTGSDTDINFIIENNTGDVTSYWNANGDLVLPTISATTYYNLPIDVYVTGGSYNQISGVATFTNNTGGTFTVNGFSTGGGGSFTGGTVTGPTNFIDGLSANTVSATTYYNLPIDVYVTGGTYSDGTAVFTNNTGGTFNVAGLYTGGTDVYVTGGTYNDGITTYTNNTGGTFNITSTTNYSAGVISGSTGWSSTGTGQINLPNVKVALYDNANNIEPLLIYNVASGTTGVSGIPLLTNNDTNYIVIEYNGGSPIYNVYDNDAVVNDSSVVLFMVIYRADNFIHVLEFGNQGAGLANKLNDRFIMTDRFGYESGLALGLSGSTGVITLTAGVAWNGPNRQLLDPLNSQDDIFFKNFHSGGTWVYTTTGDTLNNTYYDDGTDIVTATGGKYLTNWYFRGQEINDHLYEVYGTDEYDSVALAQLATEPPLPELITSHAILLGRIIVLVGTNTGLTESAFTTVFQPTQVTAHNDLNAIQGGMAGQYYHLNANQYNNIALTNVDNNFSVGQTFNAGFTATTLSAATIVATTTTIDSLSATTLSGGTIYGDGSNITNIPVPYGIINALANFNFLT